MQLQDTLHFRLESQKHIYLPYSIESKYLSIQMENDIFTDCLSQMNNTNARKTTQYQFEHHASHFSCHCDPSKQRLIKND